MKHWLFSVSTKKLKPYHFFSKDKLLLNSLHNYNLSSFNLIISKNISIVKYLIHSLKFLHYPPLPHNISFHVKRNISSQLSNLFTKWTNYKTEISIPTAACRKQVLSTVYQPCHLFCPLSIAIRSKFAYIQLKPKRLKKFHVKQKK